MQMVLPFDYGSRQNGVLRTCIVDECSLPVYGRGYCLKHYSRWKRHGDPYTVKKSANGTFTGKTCPVDGCNRPQKVLGYCNTHGIRMQRHGDVEHLDKVRKYPEGTTCLVDECGNRPFSHGYCPMHWARVKSNGDPLVVQRTASWSGIECLEDGCTSQAWGKGRCRPHYIQFNMAAFIAYGMKRRAAKAGAYVCDYSPEQLRARMEYFGFRCWMCGSADAPTVDHVKPLSKGGLDCLSNFRPACVSCNSRKKDRWYGIGGLHRFIKT